MTEVDVPRRKSMPAGTKLAVAERALGHSVPEEVGTVMDRLIWALREMGYTIREIEFDHDPALARRRWNEAMTDRIPASNDPNFIVIRTKPTHKVKTFGPGGERRITTRGSDVGENSRDKDIAHHHEEFLERMRTKVTGESRAPTGRMRSRGFNKGLSRKMDGRVLRRSTE